MNKDDYKEFDINNIQEVNSKNISKVKIYFIKKSIAAMNNAISSKEYGNLAELIEYSYAKSTPSAIRKIAFHVVQLVFAMAIGKEIISSSGKSIYEIPNNLDISLIEEAREKSRTEKNIIFWQQRKTLLREADSIKIKTEKKEPDLEKRLDQAVKAYVSYMKAGGEDSVFEKEAKKRLSQEKVLRIVRQSTEDGENTQK